MSRYSCLLAVTALAVLGFAGAAAANEGPVATACKDEIAKYCADKEHGHGDVRACLEAQKEKLSKECKTALDTTGPGKGMMRMRERNTQPGKPEAEKPESSKSEMKKLEIEKPEMEEKPEAGK